MSSVFPGYTDHHATRPRRQSSQSHPNLSDQMSANRPLSPNHSASYLPSTTYQSTSQSRSRAPSTSHNVSRIDTSVALSPTRSRGGNAGSSANPDDYYRPFSTEPALANYPTTGLHQEALRTIGIRENSSSRVGSNGSYSTAWSVDDPRDTALPPNIPGLKSRKSSVKNLVAQINASSSDEPPPIPVQRHISPNNSTMHTPNTFLSSAHISQFGSSSRNYSNPNLHSTNRLDGSTQPESMKDSVTHSNYQQRPLFGEVVPTSATPLSVGYGIANPRRRAGSEASPMHSPNPMFPPDQRDSQFVLSPAVYSPSNQKLDHRRTNSDRPTTSHNNATSLPSSYFTPPRSERRPPTASRIPVSSRRLSSASDSGSSAPNSRTTSAHDKQRTRPEQGATSSRATNAKQSLSIERSAPGRITSPGRSVQQGAKSPSLRANIIVPPPKISPPLRSSRPRMPVSSASTAASRARMAEKFNTMQKLNNEKRTAQRRPSRPPELTDIDFVERRSRITRALTKSKEQDELRPSLAAGRKWERSHSRTSSARPDTEFEPDFDANQSQYEGAMQADQTPYTNSHNDAEQDRQEATTRTLHMMQRDDPQNHNDDVDSPTLGHGTRPFDHPAMQLQTHYLKPYDDTEPLSALTDMTAGTEATIIDPEPQDENAVDRPSVLSHIIEMRERSPEEYEPERNTVDYSDRTDVESVNLIFRNTAYLDDDEAVSKGYRPNFVDHGPLPEEHEEHFSHRDSWTSSIPDEPEQTMGDNASISIETMTEHDSLDGREGSAVASTPNAQSDSVRNTMASDAYTIINVVLQQHSTSGIVDQQLADDVYQKILESCPEMEDEGAYDSEQIEQLCLQEIGRRDETEHFLVLEEEAQGVRNVTTPDSVMPNGRPAEHTRPLAEETSAAPENNLLTLPSTTYGGHRHKSSLDSAEDWASTSPSIGDWMRFADDHITPPNELHDREQSALRRVTSEPEQIQWDRQSSENTVAPDENLLPLRYEAHEETLQPEEYGTAIIRAPSRSPPPPPKDDVPSIDKVAHSHVEDGLEATMPKLPVPHRVASLGQTLNGAPSSSRPVSTRSRAEVTPWEVQDSTGEVVNPEVRRLNKRKHILKELVDTEFTYQRDMRVLCDIYKQTATAALTEDDIRVLFGNVEQVQQFAREFLVALKQASKPTYSTDRNERKKDKKEGVETLLHTNSSSSTLASTKPEIELSDVQKDRETRIGDAFEGSLAGMESVYTEYIRNRHAANLRLETLQKSTAAQDWLKECRDNSSDITNAWNLDALLVKPVQRITKYPLLLRELIDATAEDHADLPTLRRVLTSVTDINMRINEVKKHAEMLDQVLNRKRGQSDVRTGLSKAFGRRAEKIRQHVGITDMYEDTEYDKLRIAYDNNYVQLMVVANDCQSYEKGITQWVTKMVDIAAAAEGWVDVGHSHHQQEESKLRHLAMIIRNVHNIALPDHLEHLQKKVIQPMTKTVDTLQRFKDEPKGLLQKRDKRLVDYAQMKNKKDRGERIDKRTAERMDQWEALNTEAKERMRKLLRATAHLVQSCQGHLVQLQMSWMAMIQQKFSNVMGINLSRLTLEEVEKDWQVDFDYQEASALALGICNGSLMLQAANMTSFLTPGSTLVGDDSPRQMSFSSTNKRSISLNSETSNVPSLDFSSRPSGSYNNGLPESHFDRPYPYPNGRTRAASTTSGKSTRNPDNSTKSSVTTKHTSASANFARPGTSPSIIQQDVFAPPRLSLETHSPLMSSFQRQTLAERPMSSSTFFSATAGPSQPSAAHRTRGSGVFTSALPMSDSPVQERHPVEAPLGEPKVLFTAASLYEFNIDRALREAGFPYLTYVTGEIFDVLGERGELWLAKNQDDPQQQVGWIWNKHFAKLAE